MCGTYDKATTANTTPTSPQDNAKSNAKDNAKDKTEVTPKGIRKTFSDRASGHH